MDFPEHFRCPISMELMKDPVIICTGVTYDRKSIEKWLGTYKKKTCPATNQPVENLEMTPNHTLKRLIDAWENAKSPEDPIQKNDELVSLLQTIESTPFKVSSLKKLRSLVQTGEDGARLDFKKSGCLEILVKIFVQVLSDSGCDFTAFRASEEAIGVLDQLLKQDNDEENPAKAIELLMKPECIKSLTIMLQRGSSEARFATVSLFQKMAKSGAKWSAAVNDQGVDFFKSLLEIVSDEMSGKASSSALQVLIEVLGASKRSRAKAIEAGALCTLIELLPDSSRSKCERIMFLLKLLCERAEGRLGLVEHGLGIAAISKKMLNVSTTATKLGIKILWLICGSNNIIPAEKVLEEMLVCGCVKKLVVLLHLGASSSSKERIVKMFKYHGNFWKKYPCFPSDVRDYLGLGRDEHDHSF